MPSLRGYLSIQPDAQPTLSERVASGEGDIDLLAEGDLAGINPPQQEQARSYEFPRIEPQQARPYEFPRVPVMPTASDVTSIQQAPRADTQAAAQNLGLDNPAATPG